MALDNDIPTPPFLGSRVAKGIPLDEITPYLNQTALFRNQWGFRPEDGEDDAAFKERVGATLREELANNSIIYSSHHIFSMRIEGKFA